MVRFGILTMMAVLLVGGLFAQDDEDEVPPPFIMDNLLPITTADIAGLQRIGELGKGGLVNLHVRVSGDVIIVTTRGAYIYLGGDLTATPRRVDYDPNPYVTELGRRPAAPGSVLEGDLLTTADGVTLNFATGETTYQPDTQLNIEPSPVEMTQDEESGAINATLPDGRIVEDLLCSERGAAALRGELSPDGNTLYVAVRSFGTAPGRVKVFDLTVDPPAVLTDMGDFRLVPSDLEFGADGRYLYAAMSYVFPRCSGQHPDTGVHVYDMTTGDQVGIWESPQGIAQSLAVMADGTVVVGDLRSVVFWRDGEIVTVLEDDEWEFFVNDLDASDSADFVAGYPNRETLVVWNSAGEQILELTNVANDFWGRDIAIIGDTLIYNSDSRVTFRRLPDGDVLHTLEFDYAVRGIYWGRPGASLMGTGGGDARLVVVEGPQVPPREGEEGPEFLRMHTYTLTADGPEMLNSFDGPPLWQSQVFGISANGGTMFYVDNGGDISMDEVWATPEGGAIFDTETGAIGGYLFTAWVAAVSPDNRVLIGHFNNGGNLNIYGIPSES